jgi:ATP-dependent RNA helicase DDX46/PRP5
VVPKILFVCCLGLQDSDDEDIEGDIEQQIETMMAPKRTVKEVTAVTVPGAGAPAVPTTAATANKLELAKRLASKIQLEKNLGADTKAQLTAEAVMKGGILAPQPKMMVSVS